MGSQHIEEESQEVVTAAGLNVGGMTLCIRFNLAKEQSKIHLSIDVINMISANIYRLVTFKI